VSATLAPKFDRLTQSIKEAGPTGNANVDEMLGNLTSNLLAGGVGALVGGPTGALTAAAAERFNRQLHEDEKAAIKSKAKGNKAKEDKLTRAACYAVKCWAEYPKGSDQYNANYVSQAELIDLQPELDWVKSQQAGGQFGYSSGDYVRDTIKGTGIPVAKNGVKVVTGAMAVAGGITACSSVAGCALGGPAAVFGGSEALEGATGLYRFVTGDGAEGYNPVRDALTNNLPVGWGNTVYDIGSLGSNLLSLGVRLPYNVGVTEGIDRTKSIFGVTASKWDNPKINPFTKQPLPSYVGQGILTYGVGSKGVTVVNDIREPKE
jgi:filamentous hemagglutinin